MKHRLLGILALAVVLIWSTHSPVCAKNLITFKLGQTFTFDVTDGVGNSWDYEVVVSGKTSNLKTNKKVYFIMEQSGFESPMDYELSLLRSTSTEVYGYVGFSDEDLAWKKDQVGTSWRYTAKDGREIQTTIEAEETVTVPAGTFGGCLRFLKECISCDPPVEQTRQWIKPGFFIVKEIEYGTDKPPKLRQLKHFTK